MPLITSSRFASSCHGFGGWKSLSQKIIDDLHAVCTDGHGYNLGIIYMTDHLAKDAGRIVETLRAQLKVKHWFGSIGVGVMGSGIVRGDKTAVSVMIGQFEEDDFALLPRGEHSTQGFSIWKNANNPMLVMTHVNPAESYDIKEELELAVEKTGGFLLGGVSRCREEFLPKRLQNVRGAKILQAQGIDALAFSDRVQVATMLSQGIEPIGGKHTITKSYEETILELDGQSPQAVFEEDLRILAIEKIGQNPDDVILEGGRIPQEIEKMFKGTVLTAFPIKNSDSTDARVHAIKLLDDDGTMVLDTRVSNGESFEFASTGDAQIRKDLGEQLMAFRARLEKERGGFNGDTIKGGFYISSHTRLRGDDGRIDPREMELIYEILGEFPLCGFYGSGEIKGMDVFGGSGILTVFL